jgi:hypothetical protein
MGDFLEVFEADDGEVRGGEAVLAGVLGGAGLALGGDPSGKEVTFGQASASIVAATRSIGSRARSRALILTFETSRFIYFSTSYPELGSVVCDSHAS